MGRKSTYTEAIAKEICERIAEGEPLRQICRDNHMPGWVTVYAWINTHPDFAERFAHARDLGADAIAEECLAIADTPLTGEEITDAPTGRTIRKADMLGHRKLQVETRLKLLAKWNPKKYGEAQKVELSGGLKLTGMSNEELEAEIASLTAQIGHSAISEGGVVPTPQPDDDEGISDLL